MNHNFQSEAISKLRTARLVTTDLKSLISYWDSRILCSRLYSDFQTSRPVFTKQVIFKWGQVKTELLTHWANWFNFLEPYLQWSVNFVPEWLLFKGLGVHVV